MTPLGRLPLALAGLVALASVGRADGDRPLLRDEAKLFKDATRQKIVAEVTEIRRLFHRDVVVETMTGLPAAEKKRVKALRSRDEAKYFAELGRQHARAAETDGVHILICLDPKRVAVTAWPESQEAVFSADDAERVRKRIAHRRYTSGFDQAVLDGLAEVKRTLQANLRASTANEGPASGLAVGAVLLAGLAAWAVLSVANSRTGDDAGSEPEARPAAGVLGGMFGSTAALWIYDRLYPPPRPGARLEGGALTPAQFGVAPPPPPAETGSHWPALPSARDV